ncbi:MAG: hypothetical protein PHR51_01220 [Patescibacteria group bacterium]|nr:hypothetical protein [Patescibacteria group bacterium]
MKRNQFVQTALGKFIIATGVILAVVVIVVGFQLYNATLKFTAIAKIPPATEYNLSDPINQAAYTRLQAAYETLDGFKGGNLYELPVIDPGIARANAYKDLGDTGRAILSYQWLNKYRPGGLQGFNNLANLYVSIGDYQKAESNYLIAIQNSKGMHTEPYEGLYNLYSGYLKDKLPKIENILLTAIQQDPTQTRSSYRMMLAQYYTSVGRTGDARTQYEAILKYDPSNVNVKTLINELGGK